MTSIIERKERLRKDKTAGPEPLADESPLLYAERLGQWYSVQRSQEHKKTQGQYFTPAEIARFMAFQVAPAGPEMRILDPGAGCGILACAVCEHLVQCDCGIRHLRIDLYETDAALAGLLEKCMSYLSAFLEIRSIKLDYHIHTCDFILAFSESLCTRSVLFSGPEPDYDLCVSNPPYFKLSKSDRRAVAASAVVHGQPNIYALFMAVSAALLKKDGQFVFITPRSFASGFYFRRFRDYFFGLIRPEHVHLFDSRRDGFRKDGVLQEMIILKGIRLDRRHTDKAEHAGTLGISVSATAKELDRPDTTHYRTEKLLNMNSRMKVLRLPRNREEAQAADRIFSWPGSFKEYGLRISTGPVVPFRARRFLSGCEEQPEDTVPLLWLHHVRPMNIQWPLERFKKPQWLRFTEDSLKICVKNQNMVLLRRFSAKEEDRRLVAAPCLQADLPVSHLGLENHLNYIYRPNGILSQEEAVGLAVLLNSKCIDTYFRVFNGNTQVGATEISLIPLPPYEVILAAGKKALQEGLEVGRIETIAGMFFEPQKESVS